MVVGGLLAGLVTVGCGAGGTIEPEAVVVAAMGTIVTSIQIDPQLADAAVAAIGVWADATNGAYAPQLTIGLDGPAQLHVKLVDQIAECNGVPAGSEVIWGCMDPSRAAILIAQAAPENLQVSVLMHEIGHSLSLEHGGIGLMWPGRSRAERLDPCVDADTLVALETNLGVSGTPSCL